MSTELLTTVAQRLAMLGEILVFNVGTPLNDDDSDEEEESDEDDIDEDDTTEGRLFEGTGVLLYRLLLAHAASSSTSSSASVPAAFVPKKRAAEDQANQDGNLRNVPVGPDPIVDERTSAETRTMKAVEGDPKQHRRLRDLSRKSEKRDA